MPHPRPVGAGVCSESQPSAARGRGLGLPSPRRLQPYVLALPPALRSWAGPRALVCKRGNVGSGGWGMGGDIAETGQNFTGVGERGSLKQTLSTEGSRLGT